MKVHLVAVCGTGMGSLAGMLEQQGHRVRGTDKAFYPPMSDKLREWGIERIRGFDPAHIAAGTELVVVGNACRRTNPEARAAERRGIRVMSFPQAVAEIFIRDKRSIVVAGTHGKTTTTGLIAYLLHAAGKDPSFLVGGVLLDFERSFRLGQGEDFVIEGDEYDSAFFDNRPKFVHYRPRIAVLTSVEYDHADIYPDMDAYRRSFETLVEMLPEDGLLIACADDEEVMRLAGKARCAVSSYGLDPGADWCGADLRPDGQGMRFVLDGKEHRLPMSGRHNVANALAALAVLDHLGVGPQQAVASMQGFAGLARRMQERGKVDGVCVVDDFAHHPTEVRETVRAARGRYPDQELVAVFEPRTNTSRRAVFQDAYVTSFDGADRVLIVPPFGVSGIPERERFDSAKLVESLREQCIPAMLMPDPEAVVADLSRTLAEGVVLIMSNGAFGGIHHKLLRALEERAATR
ncbi:MAG: hypothetical protein JXR96_24190 [Deltaproteobacteria bacterium]|nr:hypothetical protein [Deltaproteobacteria bacterium]